MITQKKLKEILKYNKTTGEFYFRKAISRHKKGGKAGHLLRGRRYITIEGTRYNAAKLAWLYVYGEYHSGQMVYRNCDECDLRISNLIKYESLDLDQKTLKDIIHYDPDTGIFTWKSSCIGRKGKDGRAGNKCRTNGYRFITVNNKHYSEGRLAWLYMEGYWPEHQIDHINRIRDDNRWCNLRHVTVSCNVKNRAVASNSTSGVTGVYFNKNANKWQAYIRSDSKKSRYLGIFENKDHAVKARWESEVRYGFKNCQTTSSAYLYLKDKGLI